jgi:hypothetical protein
MTEKILMLGTIIFAVLIGGYSIFSVVEGFKKPDIDPDEADAVKAFSDTLRINQVKSVLLSAYVRVLNDAYQKLISIDNNGDYDSVHNNSLEEILLPIIEEIEDLDDLNQETLEMYEEILFSKEGLEDESKYA